MKALKWIGGIMGLILIIILFASKESPTKPKGTELNEPAAASAKKNTQDSLKKWTKILRKATDDMQGAIYLQPKSASDFGNVNEVSAYLALAVVKDSIVSPPKLHFSLKYKSDNWLFIESAFFKIDDAEEVIKIGLYKVKRDNSGGKVWETVDAAAEENLYYALLTKIATAKKVKMRINGKDKYDERMLSQSEIKGISEVMSAYNSLR